MPEQPQQRCGVRHDLVIIGILNVALGGVIRLICVGFDIFIRDKVLSRRHLFVAVPINDQVGIAPVVGSAAIGTD
jgi:hypothetical protein